MDLNNTLHTKENTVLYRLKLFIKNKDKIHTYLSIVTTSLKFQHSCFETRFYFNYTYNNYNFHVWNVLFL